MDKIPSKQHGEKNNELQGDDKNPVPTETMDGIPPNRPEDPQKDSGSREVATEDMEIGDLDLDRLEATCFDKDPTKIPLQQVSLLEKAIIQAKNANNLGVVMESLKVTKGKGKNSKKDKRGRPSNVQRIKVIEEQLVMSGQYPTIDATLSPSN